MVFRERERAEFVKDRKKADRSLPRIFRPLISPRLLRSAEWCGGVENGILKAIR